MIYDEVARRVTAAATLRVIRPSQAALFQRIHVCKGLSAESTPPSDVVRRYELLMMLIILRVPRPALAAAYRVHAAAVRRAIARPVPTDVMMFTSCRVARQQRSRAAHRGSHR